MHWNTRPYLVLCFFAMVSANHIISLFFHLLSKWFLFYNNNIQLLSRQDFSALRKQILKKFISMGSYFPEVHDFGNLIMSTKVFRLIIYKTL